MSKNAFSVEVFITLSIIYDELWLAHIFKALAYTSHTEINI